MTQPPTPREPPPRRILITAGPTQEPIDAVRYLGNRSSGRLGIALAEAAAARGWTVTLLLGATPRGPSDTRIRAFRFRTTADLEGLLREHLADCDVLVMAAAVADYRPKQAATPADLAHTKIRRKPEGLTLDLEPTPDLLAACAARKRPDQLIVGFALEPRERMLSSARDKLTRKSLDMIVANPLETMDAETIEAALLSRSGPDRTTGGPIPKDRFAAWLIDEIDRALPA